MARRMEEKKQGPAARIELRRARGPRDGERAERDLKLSNERRLGYMKRQKEGLAWASVG